MLQHLDMLVAFAVVMLGLSLLMTVFTQMLASLLGLRGAQLRRGLTDLLGAMHPELAAHARAIAEQVLQHPLVSDSVFANTSGRFARRWRLATSIRLEELVGIMERLAADAKPPSTHPSTWTVKEAMAHITATAKAAPSPEVQAAMAQTLQLATAVKGALPANVTLQLDRAAERIPVRAEQNLDGLKSWFDSAMDRTRQRFTLHARIVTVTLSVLFVLTAHVDALRILRQLSDDAEIRGRLVALSDTMQQHAQTLLASPAAGQAGGAALEPLKEQAQAIRTELGKAGLVLVPDPYPGLLDFSNDSPGGLLAAMALLSLGAPFWFNLLKNVTSLRPLLSTQAPDPAPRRP